MKSFKTFLFCALLLFFAIQTTNSACAEIKFSGNYSLNLYGVSRWKTDYLSIKKIGSKDVEGTIGLDWNILQEARLPANFEKMHEIPFRGEVLENGNCLKFKVSVAGIKEYSFTLFLMEYKEKPAFVGFVEIKSLLGGAFAVKTGVLAVMK